MAVLTVMQQRNISLDKKRLFQRLEFQIQVGKPEITVLNDTNHSLYNPFVSEKFGFFQISKSSGITLNII